MKKLSKIFGTIVLLALVTIGFGVCPTTVKASTIPVGITINGAALTDANKDTIASNVKCEWNSTEEELVVTVSGNVDCGENAFIKTGTYTGNIRINTEADSVVTSSARSMINGHKCTFFSGKGKLTLTSQYAAPYNNDPINDNWYSGVIMGGDRANNAVVIDSDAHVVVNVPAYRGEKTETIGIFAEGMTNVVIQGDLTVNGSASPSGDGYATGTRGINCGNLTITESGKLKITGPDTGVYGSVATEGNVDISAKSLGVSSINVKAGATTITTTASDGIAVSGEKTVAEGATLTINDSTTAKKDSGNSNSDSSSSSSSSASSNVTVSTVKAADGSTRSRW